MGHDQPSATHSLPHLGILPVLALAAALAAALAFPGHAAGQTVTGHVIDVLTGAPVAQAAIQPIDSAGEEWATATTDGTGRFVIPLDPGEYTFRVEHISYRSLDTPPVELGRGELVTIEIRLGPVPIEMEPLVVRERGRDRRGNPAFYRRMEQQQRIGRGRFLTREDIERERAVTVNDLLARQPGLRLTRVRMSDVIVMTARGQSCLPTLFFDGVPVRQGVSEIDLANWFQPDMVEGIEIYPTAASAPAELRTGRCGVIAIWSRSDPGDGAPFTLRRLLVAGGFGVLFVLLRVF